MRITLVISSLRAGGAERVLSLMASYWADQGWPITLLTLSGSSETPFYPLHPAVSYRPLGVDAVSEQLGRAVANNARRLGVLREAVRTSKPDVVISFLDRANVLTLLATVGLGIPVVVSERIDPRHRVLGQSWKLLRQLTYPLAARVVAQTEAALSYFPAHIRRHGAVVPNPVLRPHGADQPVAHMPGTRTLVAVGRFYPQKGFDLLLRAFAQVAPAHPEWQLDIWGEGPLRGELEALRDSLGLSERVRLPGLTREPGAQMAGADMFVLSSRYEGFPNVLCEAMACGLPVISFDCPSGPREIIRHGENGLLVTPADSDALAVALGRLMADNDARRALAAHAPEVLSRFGLPKVMLLWETLLQELTPFASSSSSARSTTAGPSAS